MRERLRKDVTHMVTLSWQEVTDTDKFLCFFSEMYPQPIHEINPLALN